jgi:hypothetical protein
MKSAQQLQQETFQAYNTFRSIPANVALITSILVQISTVADAAAHLGLYSCSFDLGKIDGLTSSTILFERFLTQELSDLGYTVSFSTGVSVTSVSLDWTPEDDS